MLLFFSFSERFSIRNKLDSHHSSSNLRRSDSSFIRRSFQRVTFLDGTYYNNSLKKAVTIKAYGVNHPPDHTDPVFLTGERVVGFRILKNDPNDISIIEHNLQFCGNSKNLSKREGNVKRKQMVWSHQLTDHWSSLGQPCESSQCPNAWGWCCIGTMRIVRRTHHFGSMVEENISVK